MILFSVVQGRRFGSQSGQNLRTVLTLSPGLEGIEAPHMSLPRLLAAKNRKAADDTPDHNSLTKLDVVHFVCPDFGNAPLRSIAGMLTAVGPAMSGVVAYTNPASGQADRGAARSSQ